MRERLKARGLRYVDQRAIERDMIIDCHGHYTTAPDAHNKWREAQKAAFKAGEPAPPYPFIGDNEIRATIEENQLRSLVSAAPT